MIELTSDQTRSNPLIILPSLKLVCNISALSLDIAIRGAHKREWAALYAIKYISLFSRLLLYPDNVPNAIFGSVQVVTHAWQPFLNSSAYSGNVWSSVTTCLQVKCGWRAGLLAPDIFWCPRVGEEKQWTFLLTVHDRCQKCHLSTWNVWG